MIKARAKDRRFQYNPDRRQVSIVVPKKFWVKMGYTGQIPLLCDVILDETDTDSGSTWTIRIQNIRTGTYSKRVHGPIGRTYRGPIFTKAQSFKRYGPYLYTQAEAEAKGLDWDSGR